MAVKLFQKRRQAAQQDQNQDYIEEKWYDSRPTVW
jgi:uncharacterized protein YbdZ (MbtH family)